MEKAFFPWVEKWEKAKFVAAVTSLYPLLIVMQTSSMSALWNSPVHAQWCVSRHEERKALLEMQTTVLNLMLNWQMHLNWAKCICSMPLGYPNCDVCIKLTLHSLSSQVMYSKCFLIRPSDDTSLGPLTTQAVLITSFTTSFERRLNPDLFWGLRNCPTT